MIFTRLGFTMFRLEAYQNHGAGEQVYVPVQLIRSRNSMNAFLRL